jgi:hypothetical protein
MLCHLLFAFDYDRWGNIAGGMKSRPVDNGNLVAVLLTLTAIGLLLWLIVRFFTPRDKDNQYCSPLGLFLELCRAHKLPWGERWLLWQVAAAHRLRQPARLFLEPEWLTTEALPPKLQARAHALGNLRGRLFAEEPPDLEEPLADGQTTISPDQPVATSVG